MNQGIEKYNNDSKALGIFWNSEFWNSSIAPQSHLSGAVAILTEVSKAQPVGTRCGNSGKGALTETYLLRYYHRAPIITGAPDTVYT